MVEFLELKPRAKIFESILKSPGIYLKELQKKLKLPMGQLEHHLKYLEKAELIVSKVEGGH